MDEIYAYGSTDTERSVEETSLTTNIHNKEEIQKRRSSPRHNKTSIQQKKKQKCEQKNEALEEDNEDEDFKQSKKNFYRALENNSDKYIPENARAKFPMKAKIQKLIHMLTHDKTLPSCGKKHSLMKKWTVKGGKLCHATANKTHRTRTVTAYEEIFDQIFKVDKKKNFQRTIEGLSMDVKDKTCNISKQMIKLYSENCHKRDHKVRGVTPKRQKSETQENEEQQKIDDFIQTLNDCTAVGYFQKQNDEMAPGTEPKKMKRATVVEEPTCTSSMTQKQDIKVQEQPIRTKEYAETTQSKNMNKDTVEEQLKTTYAPDAVIETAAVNDTVLTKNTAAAKPNTDEETMTARKDEKTADEAMVIENPTAVETPTVVDNNKIESDPATQKENILQGQTTTKHNSAKRQKTSEPAEQPTIALKLAAVNMASAEKHATDVAQLPDRANDEFSGDKTLVKFKEVAQVYFKREGQKRKSPQNMQKCVPPYGFNNEDGENVLCWMNSILMIVLHLLPKHVISSLTRMKFPSWTEMKYSTTENEFVGFAYDIVRQMIQVQPKYRLALNGNGITKPYPSRMAEIIRNDVNSTEGRGDGCSSWVTTDTHIDVMEMMIRNNGILKWLNRLDPCNKHFLLPEMEVVEISRVSNKTEIKNYAENVNFSFDGPDGVLSILDRPTVAHWFATYNKNIADVEDETFGGKKCINMTNEEGKKMQEYQEAFQIKLTIQEVLDKSYNKVTKSEDGKTYTINKIKTFSDYIAITMTTPLDLDHFRTVDSKEDEQTKKTRLGKGYKHGETRMYHENRPVRYGIRDKICQPGYIYEYPNTRTEAESQSKKKIRHYTVYGLIVRPIGEQDTGNGHFECFVRHQEKRQVVWRHFDDDEYIQEYDNNGILRRLDDYTIVAVFMKDITPKKK